MQVFKRFILLTIVFLSLAAGAGVALAAQPASWELSLQPAASPVMESIVSFHNFLLVIITGADVIHAFAVPSFGVKMDSIPGRVNETWFKALREGVYYSQCSELCGKDHAYMPIAVRVVSEQAFATWLEEAKKKYAASQPQGGGAIATAELAK